MASIKPLEYEVNIDDTKDIIEALPIKLMDPKTTYFGTYEEDKVRIELEIKLPKVGSMRRKMIEKIIKNTKQLGSPLILTRGKGDDIEDENKEEDVEEEDLEEEKPPKKKGKIIITNPAKSSPIVFTRRSAKSKRKLKLGKEDEVPNVLRGFLK